MSEHNTPYQAYHLTGECLVQGSGKDLIRFLQGQFTCDVEALAVNHHTTGACCTNKGRMVALFELYRSGENEVWLRLPFDAARLLLDHLAKYQVFFKCELVIAEQAQVWGLEPVGPTLGTTESEASTGAFLVDRNDREGDCAEIWLTDPAASHWCTMLEETRQPDDRPWYQQEFEAGHARVGANTSGQFIPQALRLTERGGISFKKGCYTGQEIVARTHYLGKVKKQLGLFSLHAGSEAPVEAGAGLYLDQRKAAEIADVLPLSGQTLLLAVHDPGQNEFTLSQDGAGAVTLIKSFD